jgi:hypothetical protein
MNATAWIINLLAIGCLLPAFFTNRQLALAGLKKGLRTLAGIAPVCVVVASIVAIVLAFVTPESIGTVLGESSGIGGILVALGLDLHQITPRNSWDFISWARSSCWPGWH